MGFAHLGSNVKISSNALIYDCERISIGDNSRMDDLCVLAGKITIGRNIHITVFCNLAGGTAGVTMEDYSTLAYGSHIIAQTDDYSGKFRANSTLPRHLTNPIQESVVISRHSILGTGCIVLPGVTIAEETAGGARSLFTSSTEPWGIYVGSPAKRVKELSKDLLQLETEFLRGDP